MKPPYRLLAVLTALALLLPGSAAVQAGAEGEAPMPAQADDPAAGQAGPDTSAERQLLVRFEDGVTPAEIDTINQRLGVKVVNRMMDGKLLLVEVPYVGTLGQIIDAYAATDGVRYAEPDQPVSIPMPQPEQPGADDGAPHTGLPKVD